MEEPQLMTLGSLSEGTEFWFGCIVFEYLKKERFNADEDIIYCRMERGEHYVYISSAALVSLEL